MEHFLILSLIVVWAMNLIKAMKKTIVVIVFLSFVSGIGGYAFSQTRDDTLVSRFEYLSKNGNSSCSLSFRSSIPSMPDNARLQGSCCAPMSLHRYREQVEGLKKYSHILEIPSDPYDIEIELAKKLVAAYDNIQLTAEEQKAYDYAMQHSHEKGPCCCKCWRWTVYGGLAKHLIRDYKFTGEQVTEIWNLSDGCGGDDEHHH